MTLVFRVLGAIEVWSDDRRLPVMGARHQRVLTMLLLSANRVVPLDRLVEAAWDDEPPATAARQVRKIVANLRRLLPGGPDLIVTEDPGYRTALGPEALDLSQFNAALARAKEAAPGRAVAELRAALALWRGPVMAGAGGRVIDAVTAGLEERRLAATERLLELRLELGGAREVVEELRDLVAAHPLRESPRGMLMLALYRSGRQADALGEFEELRHHLADELGIDPGRELVDLHGRILRNSQELDLPKEPRPNAGEVSSQAFTPRTLPYDPPDFVGRSAELARLREAAGSARMLAINGMGGIGKTTLAVHLAHLLGPGYPDGQVFIDLHGFTSGRLPVEPAQALDMLLAATGVPAERIPDSLTGRTALWRTVIATRVMLIVLDNALDSAQVQPVLPGSGQSLTLVTSRPYLAGIDGSVPLELGLLSQADSLELLAGAVGTHRLGAEPGAARGLVHSCGRLPLALRIAGARLHNRPQWSVQQLVDRLRDTGSRLGELVAEQRSVATTIGLSHEVLRPEQRELFRRLAMVPVCDFDDHAAAAIAGRPLGETVGLLDALLDARLLEPFGSTRYTLHDLVRDYAGTLANAAQPAELLSTRRRVIEYYLRLAGTAASLLDPDRPHQTVSLPYAPREIPVIPDPAAALDWFDTERGNLVGLVATAGRAALPWHAQHLAAELSVYLNLRGQYETEISEILHATSI